jgi:tryptophan 2,3-dioxygenase
MRTFCLLFLSFTLLACSGGSDSDQSTEVADDQNPAMETESTQPEMESEERQTPTETELVSDQAFMLSSNDLDLYKRGRSKEIEILKDAQERYAKAKDENEQLEILGEVIPPLPAEAAAKELNITPEHYNQLTDAIDKVLSKSDMKMASEKQMAEVDTSQMDEDMRANVRESRAQMEAAWGDPYASLPEGMEEDFRQQQEELARLRAEWLGLLMSMGR